MSADDEYMPPDWTDEDEADYGWDQRNYEQPDDDDESDPGERDEGYEERLEAFRNSDELPF